MTCFSSLSPHCVARLLVGTFSVGSDALHVDDGIIVLITHSRCFRVISEMSLLLVGSLSLLVLSYFCCLVISVLSTCTIGCVQSVCLCVPEMLFCLRPLDVLSRSLHTICILKCGVSMICKNHSGHSYCNIS